MTEPVALADAFAAVTDLWRPRVVAALNGQEVKVARVHGTFVWHAHDVDELFWIASGTLRIELDDDPATAVTLPPGALYVVPAGRRHRPVAEDPCEIVLVEPAGVVNTGDAPPSALTAGAGDAK